MKPVIRTNRDTLITALLVVAGIVLALALFGAGVPWKGMSVPTTSWVPTELRLESRFGVVQELGCRSLSDYCLSHGQAGI